MTLDDHQRDEDLELAEKEQALPPEIEEKRKKGLLRSGYTTGTTACAATKAALYCLLFDRDVNEVNVALPKGKIVTLKIAWIKKEQASVTSAVIKDGGDDPDATHGSEICSTVSIIDSPGRIVIDGGKGVGQVTKPGLALEVGKAAINPIPLKMIEQSVREVALDHLKKKGICVTISVPKGEEIAKKTDNPRLGIIGGISILGTTGIVMPYSTASFAASIRQSIDVGLAMGTDTMILTTGSTSEDFIKKYFGSSLPDHSYIQMGDFAGYSIKQCALKKVKKATIVGFIGKLTKMAMGVKQTHVKGSHVNMQFMASAAKECGAPDTVVEAIKQANTARHVSEIIDENGISGFYDLISKKVYEQMNEHSKGELELQVIMFDFKGRILSTYPN